MGVRRKIFSREQSPKLQELLWRGIHLQTFSCPGGGQGKVQISVRMREKLKMRSQELIFIFFFSLLEALTGHCGVITIPKRGDVS